SDASDPTTPAPQLVPTYARPISNARIAMLLAVLKAATLASYARLAEIRSTISRTTSTLGMATYPSGPASGWLGSYTSRGGPGSWRMPTTRTPAPAKPHVPDRTL